MQFPNAPDKSVKVNALNQGQTRKKNKHAAHIVQLLYKIWKGWHAISE